MQEKHQVYDAYKMLMAYQITTKKTWNQTQQELADTFDKWGVTEWQTNYPKGARLEGFRQSDADKTVKLTYVKNGKTVNLQMGSQARAVDNLRVLYLAIEDMRLNEKRGIAEVLQSAYVQLEAPRQKRNPYEVLGIFDTATLEEAEAIFKAKAKRAHPDRGGSNEQMQELTEAIELIRKEKQNS